MQRRKEFWHYAWLIAAVIVVALPHLSYVSIWISTLLILIAVWRLLAAEKGWRLPSGWIRIPLVFAGLAGILWDYRRVTGIEAGSALLLIMVAFKLLETKSPRDRTVIAIICFVLMFSMFLRAQAIWSVAYLFAGVPLCLMALLQAGDTQERIPLSETSRWTARLVIQALPIMMVLFLLFPRVPGPFWALPTQSSSATTGLSDTVSPGDITALGRSDAVAFRVRFDGAVPEPAQLYWRGPVMSYFNGRSWSWQSRGLSQNDLSALPTSGPTYAYEITLEPHGRPWLLALESPIEWDYANGSFSLDWQLMDDNIISERLAYQATSIVDGTVPGIESDRYLQAMRYLPAESNPRARTLARQLRGAADNDLSYLSAILDYFSEQEFIYTLTPPGLAQNPVDQFLFETRAGFCEHYASAFAVLARAGGIPTRLVTGYLGAEKNPLSDYWIVRQSDAHAWTEVWIDNKWHRYDPTAAVAPSRIDFGMDSAIPEAGRSPVLFMRHSPLLSEMVLGIDAIDAAWDQWVLAFGPDTQLAMLAKLGIKRPNFRHLLVAMLIACTLFFAALAWYLAHSGKTLTDPLLQLYLKFCTKIARIFRPKYLTEAPGDYADAAIAAHPQLHSEIAEITELYIGLRYENSDSDAMLNKLRKKIYRFRPATGKEN
jgi:transglutaminase-like putative cysteine protease